MAARTTPPGRQRPGGSAGPARDSARDARIIDATLSLIGEAGYGDLTMSAVAQRAGVSKATVYRRWASREDLVADALETLMLPAAPEPPAAQTLRDDLIVTLVASSACMRPDHDRFHAVLAAVTATHHQITDSLRERYAAAQRQALVTCLRRACERGELDPRRVGALLEADRLELPAVVGVLTMQEELTGALLGLDGITRLVDQVVLPLVRGPVAS